MSNNDEILTDDYVAGLLAKDAQDCSLKYSTIGMEAYHARKKPANLPKPNTRFLRNVIKDTNSHNAALLAKEAAEAHARLESLENAEGRGRRAKPGDIRRRQIGSINAILGPKAPRRAAEEEASSSRKESRRESGTDSRRRSRSRDWTRKADRRRRDGQDKEQERDRHGRARARGEHDSLGRKKPKRDEASPEDDDRRRSGRESSHRRRSRSPSRKERQHRERSTSRHRRSRKSKTLGRDPDQRRDGRKETASEPGPNGDCDDHMSDSDPLDDFVGPAPPTKSPVHTKGRGTISAFSGIDQRFAADYDPKLDVEMDDDRSDKADEKDDWPEAVEAFRDRQKLRQAREERMRAAGFSEEEVGKWGELGKKGDAREKTEADVKWAKAGEKREWDIGKEVG